jgi:metal-dependent hydrolase (beta-lactamase superfamily II)
MESLRLIIFQSGKGESFLLQHMNYPYPINILIDGGLRETISTPFLYNTAPILNLVIASHTDNDHIGGLVALLEHIKERKEMNIDERYIIQISNLWHNTFSFLEEDTSIKSQQIFEPIFHEFISIQQGIRLKKLANRLRIDTNRQFGRDNVILNNNPIGINQNIRCYIIGPSQENLKRLEKEWRNQTQFTGLVDPSPFNRSSIMVLIEVKVRGTTKIK